MSKDIREMIDRVRSLNENVQLADKVYFKTGKLTDEDKKNILSITKGDNYTKIISDFYHHYFHEFRPFRLDDNGIIEDLKNLYNDVSTYNKNVFPIVEYDVYHLKQIGTTLEALKIRREIIAHIKKLPSFAVRNLKTDIRKERSYVELKDYLHNLEYFMANFSQLKNRDEDIQIKILQKMFKGGDTTLDDLMRFVDDKSNFIGGVEFTKDDIEELYDSGDIDIVSTQGDVMIARVDSARGIKAIGCNSLWCFTYGPIFTAANSDWQQYSYNGMVYVLIDFKQKSDSEDFMYVLISPLTDEDGEMIEYGENADNYPIYNMSNENYTHPHSILNSLFGDNYEKIVKKYLTFEY